MNEEEKLQLENECLLKYSKAQMIQKYIDELEENCTLSDLWCKSQEENKRLNNIINELEKYCNEEIEDYDKNINSQYITDITREQYEGEKVCFEDMLGKLQELKGRDKE